MSNRQLQQTLPQAEKDRFLGVLYRSMGAKFPATYGPLADSRPA